MNRRRRILLGFLRMDDAGWLVQYPSDRCGSEFGGFAERILDEIIVNHLARAVRSVGSDAVAALDADTPAQLFCSHHEAAKAWEVRPVF